MATAVLVINTGSSSLKLSVYQRSHDEERLLFDGLADGIGQPDGKLELRDGDGQVLRSQSLNALSQEHALELAAQWLADLSAGQPGAVGHRVVHGGPRLLSHQKITGAVTEELRACLHFAPLHIPAALQLIERAGRLYPNIPQFACFDTAFHRGMPEVAARFPLSAELFDEGIRRYGFHGLSYESIVYQLGNALPGRAVIAHLGSGASLVALKDGQSVDTTMGLGPTGGIPMATRSGDLDPSILLYLLRAKEMDADSLEQMVNHQAGLTALSGGKSDMRALEAAADQGDHQAELAIEIFCTSIRKTIASYAAVLGGLDLLVFSGGIGENSTRVRNTICRGLDFLGIGIGSPRVRIMVSQEDLQIARHCRAMMSQSSDSERCDFAHGDCNTQA